MTPNEHSGQIVTPVEPPHSAPGGAHGVNPAALTVERLARAMGLPLATVEKHVEDGAPTAADGTMNLVHYAAWLNKRLRELDGD
jgi:hypothetical protein